MQDPKLEPVMAYHLQLPLALLAVAWVNLVSVSVPRLISVPAEVVLCSADIVASNDGEEFRVSAKARAPGTSWEIEGHECSMLRVILDGGYDQHVFLFQGASEAEYEFLLGPLGKGNHSIRLQWDRSWTPDHQEKPQVEITGIQPVDSSDPAQEPVLRAPILHLRKDTVGRFSDVPLLLYWEADPMAHGNQATYTFILSNEDGGTNTERLMARWGRTADIEWCYSYLPVPGGIEETYQARDHKTLPFRGKHEGLHPILFDTTENNNFADALADPAPVRVRMLPVEMILTGRSREAAMDRFPWTYAIMAGEMEREGKLEWPADAGTAKLSDQRNYAYLEACAQQKGTELHFDLQLGTNARWFSSDHSDPRSRIERSGCFRTTIELPAGSRAEDLRRIRVHCSPALVAEGEMPVKSPGAAFEAVNRLFLLQPDYRPGLNLLAMQVRRNLRPGQSLTMELKR